MEAVEAPRTDNEPRVLCEVGSLCALWKPAGWAVLASDEDGDEADPSGGAEAPGRRQLHAWLSERLAGRWPIAADAAAARGLAHRLDAGTSGALLWAKDYRSYYAVRMQFVARRVRKEYLCLCLRLLPAAPQHLASPLHELPDLLPGRPWTVTVERGGRPACTEIRAVVHLSSPQGQGMSLVKVRLHTGRRHQIRAHLASLGHPLVGDAAYGAGTQPSWCRRCFLHAAALAVDASCGGEPAGAEGMRLEVEAPLPSELLTALAALTPTDARSRERRLARLAAPFGGGSSRAAG